MAYRVELAPAAQRGLKKLPREIKERLTSSILALCDDPQPAGARKVTGQENTWRIRVGPFRIIYDIYDDLRLVVVLKVGRRSETTYRF
jgi:mRNA interferase RelE/StbE